MFKQPTHLLTIRPSPSTIKFTVSNRSPNTSVTLHSLNYLVGALRILLSLSAATCLLAKFQGHLLDETFKTSWLSLFALFKTFFNGVVDKADQVPWKFIGPACLVVLYLCCQRPYTEESLLVLQSLGIQTCTSSRTYLSTATTRFIPTPEIQDIFIHEAFIGFEVRYYLAIVVKNEAEMTVVFPKLLPRRAILEEVWRGAKSCAFANLQVGPAKASSRSQAVKS